MNLRVRASRIQSTILLVACFVVGVASSSSAEAPPEDDGRESRVESITITAEKRDTELEKTPVSVTPFTPAAIRDLDIRNVLENVGADYGSE